MRKPAVPDRPAGRSDEDSLAYELVAALTEQEILKRFYLDEQSAVEICAVMGITETQFRLIKSRLMARIVELSRMVPVQRDTRARTVTTRATRAKGATADIGRLVPVVAHAVAVFGDEHKASHSLALLGNQSPAHVLARSGGVEAVDRILTRIEHNIPS